MYPYMFIARNLHFCLFSKHYYIRFFFRNAKIYFIVFYSRSSQLLMNDKKHFKLTTIFVKLYNMHKVLVRELVVLPIGDNLQLQICEQKCKSNAIYEVCVCVNTYVKCSVYTYMYM